MAYRLRDIVDSIDIPVIHNGDVFYYSDIASLKEITNAHR
jgi:tRNA-dihydrouridine synthase